MEVEVDVVVPGGVPVLEQLPVAIEHDDVARRQHVLSRVGQVANRPQHVERRGSEDDADRGCHPGPLRPQPSEWPGPERLRATTCGLRNHPSPPPPSALFCAAKPRTEALRRGNACYDPLTPRPYTC